MPGMRRPTDSLIDALAEALATEAAEAADAADQAEFASTFVECCRDALGTDAAALLLGGPHGAMDFVSATSDAAKTAVRAELAAQAGPSIDCSLTCGLVRADVEQDAPRWPSWSARMCAGGFASADAVPLQRRGDCVGVLTLLSSAARKPSAAMLALARTLTASAAAVLAQRQTMLRQADVIDQLQTALSSRIQIEQAKGILAERLETDVDDAFDYLRHYARSRRRRLHDVARDVVERKLQFPRDTEG